MDFRLDLTMGWQAVAVLCAVLSASRAQFPPGMGMGPQDGPSPVLDETPVTVKAKIGTDATLPCHVLNSAQSGVTWSTNNFEETISVKNKVSNNDPRFSVDTSYNDEWNLVIDNVRPNDAGVYVCMTQTFPPQMKSVTLVVHGPPSIDTSQIQAKYIIEEGRRLQVRCVASGFPEPTVQWFKFTTDPSSQTEHKDLYSSTDILNIERLSRGDGNIYGCTAENEHGSDMYEIFVDIVYKPEISTATRIITATSSEDVTVECEIDSNPAGTLAWTRNGQKLVSSWKYLVETLDTLQSETKKTLRLTIRETDLDDSGIYSCQAENSINSASLDIKITITTTTTTVKTTTTTATKTTTKVPSTPFKIQVPVTGESNSKAPPSGQVGVVRLVAALALSLLAAVILS